MKGRERERERERGRESEREAVRGREGGRGRVKQKTERDTIRCPLKRQSGMETFQKMFLLLLDLQVKRDW